MQFLSRYLPCCPGPIESSDGRQLGQHRGLAFYTLGQRAGLQLGGARGFAAEPWYVAAKVPARNALIVVQRHEQRLLESCTVQLGRINWLCTPRTGRFSAQAKLRYRQASQPVEVHASAASSPCSSQFSDSPSEPPLPGQYAVLYESGRCLEWRGHRGHRYSLACVALPIVCSTCSLAMASASVVIRCACSKAVKGLDSASMQALAQQFNLSETTFLLPPTSGEAHARVRIFHTALRDALRRTPRRSVAPVCVGASDLEAISCIWRCSPGSCR